MRGCLALPCIAGALLAPTPRVTTTLRQSQAAPERFERADDAERLAKRIETVLARRTSRLIVVLERLVDGHNYSAIFRTCEALGVQHVWVVAPPPGDEERSEDAGGRTGRGPRPARKPQAPVSPLNSGSTT